MAATIAQKNIDKFLQDQLDASQASMPLSTGLSQTSSSELHPPPLEPIREETITTELHTDPPIPEDPLLEAAALTGVDTSEPQRTRERDGAVSLDYLTTFILPLVEKSMEERSLHDMSVAEFVEWHVKPRCSAGCRFALAALQ
jgi:hypothetical protein